MLKQVVNWAFYLVIVTTATLFTAMPTQAISLTTFRIYLDYENSAASFLMFNRELYGQTCKLDLVHKNYDELANVSRVESSIIPEHSAKPWFRYSPKNFYVNPSSSQTVRFTLRRKANTSAQEYRSYLAIYCDADKPVIAKSNTGQDAPVVGVVPRLVHHVPIIVRTGKLKAQVSFDDLIHQGRNLSFTLNRKGDRSIYGSVQIIDKKSGDILSYVSNVSVYTESKKKSLDLSLPAEPNKNLALRFVEDKSYGGSITYQQDIVLN
jgi:hypothetical protein